MSASVRQAVPELDDATSISQKACHASATRIGIFGILAGLALLMLSRSARAEPYPAQTITIVVPYSAGSGIDIATRLLAEKMQQRLRQPVIVENRIGAGGNIGAASVAKAKPDGYTLLLAANGLAIAPSLYELTYDPVTSLAPIGLYVKGAMVLVVNRDVKASTTAELIALAKGAPGKLNYGSPGVGSQFHLAMELLKLATGTDIVHIPYKSAGNALIGIIRGEHDVQFLAVQTALPNLADGLIRGLGLSRPVDLSPVSGLGTIADQIHDRNFDVELWYGLFAPAGTPPRVVDVVANEIAAIAAMPDVQDKLRSVTLVPSPSGPEELARLLKSEMSRWGGIIRQAGIAKN
jgi:tripartite-type tricarboxylate transporter receptor subunit TctC